jgi:hypothetical protein
MVSWSRPFLFFRLRRQPFKGTQGRFRNKGGQITRNGGKVNRGPDRGIIAIKVTEVLRKPKKTILEDRAKFEIISNTAFTIGRSFHKGNFAEDRANNANTTGDRVHKHHRISQLPNLFINVKILRIDIDLAFILTLKLKKFSIAFIKRLETPIIPNQTAFVHKKNGMRYRNTGFKLVNGENTDTGNINIIHVSVNVPATLKVLKHQGNHIRTFARTFFSKNKNELMRINVLVTTISKAAKTSTNKDKNNGKHKINLLKKIPLPGQGEKLQPNQTANQANAKADKGHNHEHEQKGLAGDTGTERSHPANSLSDESSHIRQQSCHSHRSTPLQSHKTTNQANAKADKSDNDKSENQRIRGNGTNKGANPLNSLSDERSHIRQDGSDSNGSFSMKSFHLSK